MPQTTLRVMAGCLAIALVVATPRVAASETSLPTLSPARVEPWAEPHGLAATGRESASVPGADVGIGPLAEPNGARLVKEPATVAIGPIMEPHG